MTHDFTHTLRSLASDRSTRGPATTAIVALALAGWFAWMVLGRVTLHELSVACQLEVEGAAHPVMSRVEGEVIATALEIGHEVARGDVLVRLDARAQELAKAECAACLSEYEARGRALWAQAEAEAATEAARALARQRTIEAARANERECASRAESAVRHAESQVALQKQQIVSELVALEATAKAGEAKAALAAASARALQAEQDAEVAAKAHIARGAELRRQTVELAGKAEIERARLARFSADIELRTIKAPAAGRLGDVRRVRVGSVLACGERLATIVPFGKTLAVAEFDVAAAGRLQKGQRATLRMDGFPWTRFGTLSATIERVASEPVGGRLRVELALDLTAPTPIPLHHGLPGSAEVEVERVTPAELLLRAGSHWLSGGTPAHAGLPIAAVATR